MGRGSLHSHFCPMSTPLIKLPPQVNGKEALFPSSYVEKIESSPSPQPQLRTLPPRFTDNSEKPVYRPFGAAHHGSDLPPPSGSEVNSIGLQQAPGQEEKNNKFGKYKSTVGTCLFL